MKKMEEKRTFWLSGGRMVPKDRANPNSYKVRRAKVGGYKDYFDDQQVEQIDAYVAKNLSPFFDYTPAQQAADDTAEPQIKVSGS
jgi:mono/diheme cytochrome c family protein